MAKQKKIVWVLGAGFSRALGGPLLRDVFSPGSFGLTQATFKTEEFKTVTGREAKTVHFLYNWGTAFKEGRLPDWPENRVGPGVRLWDDAEQFLDFLEGVSQTKAPEVFRDALVAVGTLSNGNWSQLASNMDKARLTARQLLAAESSRFLQGAEVETERWEPYREWLRHRGFADEGKEGAEETIITFNYDTALEKVDFWFSEQGIPTRLSVLLPQISRLQELREEGRALVLKLHGSTNWKREGARAVKTVDDEFSALTCNESEMVLGTPGPRKTGVTDLLENLWQEALRALSHANAIVFLGYRFPPTDAASRTRLIGAIHQNNELDDLAVHTVLGPDVTQPDAQRLKGLLHQALSHRHIRGTAFNYLPGSDPLRYYSLTSHSLLAEDFISVVPPESIFGR